MLFRHLPGETKENHKTFRQGNILPAATDWCKIHLQQLQDQHTMVGASGRAKGVDAVDLYMKVVVVQ